MPEPELNQTSQTDTDSEPLILVVDDDMGILKAVERTLRKSPVTVILANSSKEAINILSEKNIAVVISDYMMPGMNGLELLSLIRQRWPKSVGIMMTACEDIRVAADAVNRHLVNSFITKPWETAALRRSVLDAVKAYNQKAEAPEEDTAMFSEIEQQASAAAFSLARAVDARDRYTHRHSERVSAYAQSLGRALGLSENLVEDLRIGGLLHDLGKIGVPDGVLLKPGRLTDEEYQAIKRHPTIGASIIEPISFSENIRDIIRYHHENHDGTGYPDRLIGNEIPLLARVIHVIDAYEAMSANRVYRGARDSEWIVGEFLRCRGSQFNPDITDVFLNELAADHFVDKSEEKE